MFFERWDLSPSQFNVLNLVRDVSGGMTQVELSRELIMHRSNVTGLVDRLEKRGLVMRREDPTDRRAYRVVITAQGMELMREILPHYYVAAEEVWGQLTEEHARRLVEELAQVSSNAGRIAEGHRVAENLKSETAPKTENRKDEKRRWWWKK